MRAAAPVLLLLLALTPLVANTGDAQGAAAAGSGPVLHATIDGPITRATDLYVEEVLLLAAREDASAVVLEMNTPGGELEATFRITDRITQSAVPVVGYVAPRTATAWSAGTVILLSTHVAAMAPFTVIGSSQPVSLSEGGFTPINDSKIINALVAKLRAMAALHGRNETAAEEFVTKNLNLDADDALQAKVVEVVSPTLSELLVALEGRTAFTGTGNVTLHTAGKPVRDVEPTLRVGLLDIFFNPLIAGLLLLVGIYALIFGLGSPGLGAEIAGAICILLALVGLGFNVNLIALGLIALGAILLVVEVHAPGFGVFGIAGLVALIIGTLFIAPLGPTSPGGWSFPAVYQQQVLLILAGPSIAFAGFLGFALYKVQQARHRKPFLANSMVGEEAFAVDRLGPGKVGFVRYRGESWQARSAQPIEPESRVRIVGKEEAVLVVEPLGPAAPGPQAGPTPAADR